MVKSNQVESITTEKAVETLLQHDLIDSKKIVILFESTAVLRKFTGDVEEALRKNPNFAIQRDVPYKIATNMVRLGNTLLYLGLEKDQDLVSGNNLEVMRHDSRKI